nr:phospholipase-like protein [Tanacetum cinerariifolium]
MGRESKNYIVDNLIELVDDLTAWDAYPWGEYFWRALYRRLVNVISRYEVAIMMKNKNVSLMKKTKKINSSKKIGTYNVYGFVWSLKGSEVTDETKIKDDTQGKLVLLCQPSLHLREFLTSSLSVIAGKDLETENGSSRASLVAMKTMLENVIGSVKRIRGDKEDCILESQDKKVDNDVKEIRKRSCLSNLIFGDDDMNLSFHQNINSHCVVMGVNEFVVGANRSEGNLVLRSNSKFGKMTSQTRYSVVDDETRQGLKDGTARIMREELRKLRNEMRTMVMTDNNGAVVRKGVQNIPKFGGEDVKGWLIQIEQFFEDNNIPDGSKDDNVLMSCEENVESKEFVANDSSEVIDNGIDKEVIDEIRKDDIEVEGNQSKDSKEDAENKKCWLISNDIVKVGKGSKESNAWIENQIAETKSKMDSDYVMCTNRGILEVVWKPMVKMRMNEIIMSGNYCKLVLLCQPSLHLREFLTSSLSVRAGKDLETENGSSRASLVEMKTMLENVIGSVKRIRGDKED